MMTVALMNALFYGAIVLVCLIETSAMGMGMGMNAEKCHRGDRSCWNRMS